MNNIKRLSLCLIALVCTMPLLAMDKKGKKRAAPARAAASSESKDPNAELMAVLNMTILHIETAQHMMNRSLETMATRIKIIKAANAKPSEQVPAASAPAPETAHTSNAQAQQAHAPAQQPAAPTMTVEQALKALDAQDDAMQKMVSITGDIARITLDNAQKNLQNNQDNDDWDDVDDDEGESNNNNNNK